MGSITKAVCNLLEAVALHSWSATFRLIMLLGVLVAGLMLLASVR